MATADKNGHVKKALQKWSDHLSVELRNLREEADRAKASLDRFNRQIKEASEEKDDVDSFLENLDEPSDGSGG